LTPSKDYLSIKQNRKSVFLPPSSSQTIQETSRRRSVLPSQFSALLTFSLSFVILILIGTVLLSLPISTVEEGQVSIINALFTATSAVCVTGLVVVSSNDYWSPFGQFIISILMFAGGLGIMSAGLLMLVAVGRRISLTQRLLIRETLGGAVPLGNATRLGFLIVAFAVFVQFITFILLFLRLITDYSLGQALWHSFFHSISAFNNAGFTIFPESTSLQSFQSDPFVQGIIGVSIVLGSLSFPVINELARRQGYRRWTLDTKFVVIGTLGVWILGIIAILLFEGTNQQTIGNLPLGEKITNTVFQAFTSRTAGFSTIDFSETRAGTDFIFMLLMFVGGASGSVAGGIKINTAMVLSIAALAAIRGRPNIEVMRREIPYSQVARALALLILAAIGVIFFVLALSFTELEKLDSGIFSFRDIMFETVSAFGTVGLSKGITPELSELGKFVLSIAMLIGRLGPLTIILGLAFKEKKPVYRYAEERVRIG
jgi:trk system potassium uptake protein TrkH